MQTHDLKSWAMWFQPIWEGRKRFDVRIDDRNFQEGDELTLRECKPLDDAVEYTGRSITATIDYIYRGADESAPVGLTSPDANAEPVVLGLTNLHHEGTVQARRAAPAEFVVTPADVADVADVLGTAKGSS